jgi:predicted GNAT family N-acyltransferase
MSGEGLRGSTGVCKGLYTTIILNARETAVKFYISLGYEIYGEPFVEVTLPHRKMKKTLKN